MRTRTALLACLLSSAPALARAQAAGAVTITESSTSSQGGLSDGVINIAECTGAVTDSITLRWNLAQPPTGAAKWYRVFAGTSACAASGNMPSGSSSLKEITSGFQAAPTQAGSWTTAVPIRDITSVLAAACSVAATITFCVYVAETDTGTPPIQTAFTASGSIDLDTAAPGQPTSVSAASGDGALTVGWVAGSGTATTWRVTAAPGAADQALGCSGGGAPGSSDCTGSSTTSCRVTGLTNDACYSVTVQGFSEVNNPSPVSPAATGVPRPVEGFWERYAADGREQGGCGSGPAAALSLLALAALAPRLLRRRP